MDRQTEGYMNIILGNNEKNITTITLTADQIAHVEVAVDRERCGACRGRGWYRRDPDYADATVKHECPYCHGSGRIPEPVRVTLAFKEQPGDGFKFVKATDTHATFNAPKEYFYKLPLPLPLNAEIVVRKVCEECGGEGEYDFHGEGEEFCEDCCGHGWFDTGLRLTTSEKPWVGLAYKYLIEFGSSGIDLDGYGSLPATLVVASYEVGVSRKEIEG